MRSSLAVYDISPSDILPLKFPRPENFPPPRIFTLAVKTKIWKLPLTDTLYHNRSTAINFATLSVDHYIEEWRMVVVEEDMSRLHHSLEWYTRV